MKTDIIRMADSYKFFHPHVYPEWAGGMFDYIEPRTGGEFKYVQFVGLQMYIHDFLTGPVVTKELLDYYESRLPKHGLPFRRDMWETIISKYGGHLPIKICAVPEGTVVPEGSCVMTIESTDPDCFPIASHLETSDIRIWHPCGVGTVSWHARQIWKAFLEETADNLSGLDFKLHDFGARGTFGEEAAQNGGVAHLVNFLGTDTYTAIERAKEVYGEDMAGFSIPATEHSLMCSEGRNGEAKVVKRVIDWCVANGFKMVSIVADTYSTENFVRNIICGDLKDYIIRSGVKVVVRPDSGDPVLVPTDVMQLIACCAGCTTNSKGYDLLHPSFGVIQGDGMNLDSMAKMLFHAKVHKFSADNLVTGMGGKLHTFCNRDTNRWACKATAYLDMESLRWIDVFKDPEDDHSKKSQRGRVTLVKNPDTGEFKTVPAHELSGYEIYGWENQLETVFENGRHTQKWTLSGMRDRAREATLPFNTKSLKFHTEGLVPA